MFKLKTYIQSHGLTELFLVLLMLVLPFLPKVVSPVLILIFISAVVEKKLDYRNTKKLFGTPFLCLLLLFGLYSFGMFYTNNISEGFSTVERKLSFVLLPLFFNWFTPKTGNQFFYFVIQWFIRSIVLAAFTCLTLAAIYFGYELYCREYRIILTDYPYTNYFFYSYLSRFMHYGYFSLFVNMAIGFQLWLFVLNFGSTRIRTKIRQLGCVFFLSVFVFMLYAKAGMLTLALIYVFTCVYLLVRLKNKFISISVLGAFILVVVFFIRYVPDTLNRIADVKKALNETEIDKNAEESTRIRLLVWDCAWEKVVQSPWVGYGTGDAQDVLNTAYKKNTITVAYNKSLNAHNEFLQAWLEVGCIGVILLLVFLSWVVLYARQSLLFYPSAVFVCILFVSFLTESTLRTQNGVLFCCLFSGLLIAQVMRGKSKTNGL